jgi:hypothetical protein
MEKLGLDPADPAHQQAYPAILELFKQRLEEAVRPWTEALEAAREWQTAKGDRTALLAEWIRRLDACASTEEARGRKAELAQVRRGLKAKLRGEARRTHTRASAPGPATARVAAVARSSLGERGERRSVRRRTAAVARDGPARCSDPDEPPDLTRCPALPGPRSWTEVAA